MNNLEQAYWRGFLKAAQAHGLNEHEYSKPPPDMGIPVNHWKDMDNSLRADIWDSYEYDTSIKQQVKQTKSELRAKVPQWNFKMRKMLK